MSTKKPNELRVLQGFARGLEDQTYSGDRRRFFFWYQIDGRIYVNIYKTKAALLFNNLIDYRSNGTFVMLSEESVGINESDTEKHLYDLISEIEKNLKEYI